MAWTSTPILNAIALNDGCVTDAALVDATGLDSAQVMRALAKLRKHHFIYRDEGNCNRLTVAGEELWRSGQALTSGPRRGSQQTHDRRYPNGLRQRAWNALRMGRKVTVADLLLICAEGGERDPESNLTKYIAALARAGYVRRLPVRDTPASQTSNGAVRVQLINDTGPLAPVWRPQRQCLFDPNLGPTGEEIALAKPLTPIRARGQEARHA